MTKQEQAWNTKIADLRTQRDEAAKQLDLIKGDIDAANSRVTALAKEEATLQSSINTLKREVENLQKNIDAKNQEGLKVIKDLSDQHANLKVQLEGAQFTHDNLKAKLADLLKKHAELSDIPDQHAKAIAARDAALDHAKQIEADNETKKAAADKLLADARTIHESAHARELAVAAREQALNDAHQTTEFYRNRIVAYCVEKGLPIPDFQNGPA